MEGLIETFRDQQKEILVFGWPNKRGYKNVRFVSKYERGQRGDIIVIFLRNHGSEEHVYQLKKFWRQTVAPRLYLNASECILVHQTTGIQMFVEKTARDSNVIF